MTERPPAVVSDRMFVRALAALAIGALGGCAEGRSRTDAIALRLTAELGVATAVTCRGATCTATTAGGLVIPLAIAADGSWQTAPLVEPAALEAAIAAALADLGAAQPVDCGRRRVDDGRPIACALGGGGVALVTLGPDGELDLELAVTSAIAAARTAPADDAALTAASRALDSVDGDDLDDDGASDDDDDAPGPDGLAAPPTGEPPRRGPGG